MTAILTTFGAWFPRYTREIPNPGNLPLQVIADQEVAAMIRQLDETDTPVSVTAIVQSGDLIAHSTVSL